MWGQTYLLADFTERVIDREQIVLLGMCPEDLASLIILLSGFFRRISLLDVYESGCQCGGSGGSRICRYSPYAIVSVKPLTASSVMPGVFMRAHSDLMSEK